MQIRIHKGFKMTYFKFPTVKAMWTITEDGYMLQQYE